MDILCQASSKVDVIYVRLLITNSVNQVHACYFAGNQCNIVSMILSTTKTSCPLKILKPNRVTVASVADETVSPES